MDFSQYQPAAPPAFQPVPAPPKEKSYIHQPVSAHHRDLHDPRDLHDLHDLHDLRDLHAPLSISIPSGHPELSRPSNASMHPLASSSAFKAWESTGRHVHRQASNPGRAAAAATHNSTRRHGYSTRRQRSIENMQDLFSQPYGGMYGGGGGAGPGGAGPGGLGPGGPGGAGPGPHGQGQHSAAQPSSHHHHHRNKSCSTHSSTEVTV
ncbi:hypothetical protein EYF80_045868 [Liparis tanakae]|uniref:Uncharacterized protein n=1 Tax=Liparis tanakae TaxID=230148 RepID=A0A4Z2FTA7_9TELE|nr:hypothetical protein EYF80_045868 [Liparis tanakae]